MLKFNPWKSLTFWGVLSGITPQLVANFDPTAFSPTVTTIVSLVGTAVAVLGLRNAQAKGAKEVADLLSGLSGRAQRP